MKNKVQKYKERLEIKLVDAVPLIGIVPMCKRNWDVIKETFKREYNFEFNRINSIELIAYGMYQHIFTTVFPLVVYRGIEKIIN